MALQVILDVKEKFKVDYIIDVLVGRESDEVLAHRHENLDSFGCGDEHERSFWNAVIRQAMLSGYIEKEVENYGLLRVTSEGRLFLKNGGSFQIMEDNEFDAYEDNASGGTSVLDEELLVMLRDLRKSVANKKGVPPYVIFQDPSLEDMATSYPITIEELQNIRGVGVGKASRYGREFCELIARHCKENDIERFEDFRIRTVANKSKLKVSIIQSIDRQISLDDIARAKGIEYDELLDEIEAIVYSGTKLDIDYYIDDVMDEEHMLDIYDYFLEESETDSLDEAVEELGEDYPERDIRLVRIKFLSEMAN
jgi:ATP-dependent DNA helicase RecQ